MNREEIINKYGKVEFEEFLKTNNIMELLNEEGLNILNSSPRREERIDYILAFSKQLKELFQYEPFMELFLSSDISYFCINIENLEKESVFNLMNKLISMDKSNQEIAKTFGYFGESIKKEIIESKTLPMELIYEIFKAGRLTDRTTIFENYDIDLTSHNINLYNLFYNGKHSALQSIKSRNLGLREFKPLSIPTHLITKEVADKIWDKYDIFAIREIINMASYSTDPTYLNEYTKRKEEYIIGNCANNEFVSPIKDIYESAYRYYEIRTRLDKESDSLTNDEYDELYREHITYKKEYYNHKYHDHNKKLFEKLENSYKENGLSSIIELFEIENSKMISNYIIDYHFEENYHNIKLDVDELLNFYFRGNINLSQEFISIYERVSNIDYLTIEEKLELHEELKQHNMIERFYDDMAFARHIVRETIKDYSLTSETLEEYLDEELTEQYGVPVYNVKEEPFFGIVKSGIHAPDKLPTGHSYSLVGNNCVSIFGSPDASNTYLYDAETLNPDQIVHVYPRDSFTIYRPFDAVDTPTNRVNTLLTAPELISASTSYNEILILEQGSKPHEIDKDIESLKRIALYCIDNISEQDVNQAKKTGLGILLVSAKSYNPEFETTERISNPDYLWEYKYFDGTSEKEKYESRRI